MRLAWQLTLWLTLALFAAPFAYLSAKGVMKPLEGFCIEYSADNTVDASTLTEPADSYFTAPELGRRWTLVRWEPQIVWPVCARSRRGEHLGLAWYNDKALSRLGEPNLKRLHLIDPHARVFRVLTWPALSRLPVAFRVEKTVRGYELYAAWLEDDGTPEPQNDSDQAWQNARLPQRSLTRALTEAEVKRLYLLLRKSESPEPVSVIGIDRLELVVEDIDHGQRRARVIDFLYSREAGANLLCGLAEVSRVPKQVLVNGDVRFCED